ncbi:MAG: hypothetical protein L3J82_08530 [Planctomycetes bacterium]|nr:hypothetical protein [Planctomycetota bacterium]
MRQDQVLAVYVDFEFNIWEWRVERCNAGGYEPLKADCRFGNEVFNRQEDELRGIHVSQNPPIIKLG